MSVDINILSHLYFPFDEPVPYILNKSLSIKIYPISLRNSEFFLSSKDILEIDKNSIPDPKIIQMTYLKFLYKIILPQSPANRQKLLNILKLCLGLNYPAIILDEKERAFIVDNETGIRISSSQFDEIKKIILYQNIFDYDDEYVNPEFKQNIEAGRALKNKNIESPSLERKMAIITAHTGITKREQLEMSYRAHSLLFQEVYEETEYTTMYPIAAICGKNDKFDKWIYKQKKGKYDSETISVSKFNEQAGGNGEVAQQIINKKEDINDFSKLSGRSWHRPNV